MKGIIINIQNNNKNIDNNPKRRRLLEEAYITDTFKSNQLLNDCNPINVPFVSAEHTQKEAVKFEAAFAVLNAFRENHGGFLFFLFIINLEYLLLINIK